MSSEHVDVKVPWVCHKGMHEPCWDPVHLLYRCEACKLPLDTRARSEEKARLVREGLLCEYCGGRDGVHAIIEREDGVCISCLGGDVRVLEALLGRAVLALGEETTLGMEIEAALSQLRERRR